MMRVLPPTMIGASAEEFAGSRLNAKSKKSSRKFQFIYSVELILFLGIAALLPCVTKAAEDQGSARPSLFPWGMTRLGIEIGVLIALPYIYIAWLKLRRAKDSELFRVVSENAADMIALVDVSGKRLYNSPAYERILGYTPSELAKTSSLEQVHPDDRAKVIEAAKQARTTGVGERLEYRMKHKNGDWRVLESAASAIRDRKGRVTQLVIVNRDITQRKHMEEELEHNAFHDALTGLPNRSLLLNRLQHALDYGKRHENFRFALLFVDVDGLRIINDSMGRGAVDKLLIDISQRLSAVLRQEDTISRLGTKEDGKPELGEELLTRLDGDEFAILLQGIAEASDAMRVAVRVQESLTAPFLANGVEVFASPSVGIVMSAATYRKPLELLRDADLAIWRAKAKGGWRCEVFDQAMHELVLKRLKLETELRKAVEREEFVVFYQPIVSLTTGRIAGFEALLRWNHPERGLVGPVEFIDAAEEMGLIVGIGKWVMREACRQTREWQLNFASETPLMVTVNVSPRQFAQTSLLADIEAVVKETQIPAHCLQLEITETIAMTELSETIKLLHQIRDLGVRVSIDDFGTGHSSLSRLLRFPLDTLKIDRSFVRGIESDSGSRGIVRLIVTLAHDLQLKVVAEGIEADAQLAYLKAFGCEYGQGFLFSPAVAKKELEKLLVAGPFATEERR